MQTFLPANYRFSPSKLLDAEERYKFAHPIDTTHIWGYFIAATICLLLVIVIFIICNKNKNHLVGLKAKLYIIVEFALSMGILIFALMPVHYSPEPYFLYKSEDFKYTDRGNLVITMLGKAPKPTKIDDHKPYPYQLCYKGDMEYIHLGTMKNGKFTPGNEDPAPTFYKYYQYIQQHKLADKFKHNVTLKRDGRYQTRNGKAQWVLTNNKDVILHLVDNTKVKQTSVVKN